MLTILEAVIVSPYEILLPENANAVNKYIIEEDGKKDTTWLKAMGGNLVEKISIYPLGPTPVVCQPNTLSLVTSATVSTAAMTITQVKPIAQIKPNTYITHAI